MEGSGFSPRLKLSQPVGDLQTRVVWDLFPGRRASPARFCGLRGRRVPCSGGATEAERGLGDASEEESVGLWKKRRDQAYRESLGGQLEMEMPF